MAQVGEILEFVYGDLSLDDDPTKQAAFRALRSAIRKVAGAHPWQHLRRSQSVAATEDDTAGALLRPDIVNVIDPLYDGNDNIYIRTSERDNNLHTDCYWWAFDDVAITPVKQVATGCTISEGATTFTFAAWLASYIGEYVQFGAEPGYYYLSDTKEISTTYWGPRIGNGAITIRPETCRRLSLYDGNMDRLDATVTVHFWIYPAPIYHDWQTVPDHWVELLKYAILAETKGHTVDKKLLGAARAIRDQYDTELSEAIIQDPAPPPMQVPRDNRGKVRTFGRRG